MKKLLVCIIALTMLGGSTACVLADTKVYENETVSELQEAIEAAEKDEKVTTAEKTKIIEKTDPEVLEELRKDVYEEAMEKGENIQLQAKINLDDAEANTGIITKKTTIDLDSGGTLVIEQTDEPDNTAFNEDKDIEKASFLEKIFCEPVYAVNKKFGARKYTAKRTIYHALYPDTKLVLCTGYKIGTYGLKTRYTNTVGTRGIGFVSVDSQSWVEDDVATKAGADINGRGYYEVHFGPLPKLGVTACTLKEGMRSYIKLTYLNKSKKYANIEQRNKMWDIGWSLF